MISAPLDHLVHLPVSDKPIRQVVFGRWFGFEVKALKEMGVYAAGEMGWRAAVATPAYGYLFTAGLAAEDGAAERHQVVGAAFFERNVEEGVSAEWFMTGVWLHPLARGKGHFIKALPELEMAFGEFAICGPYSPTFQRLMEKHPEVRSHTVEHMMATS
jgi:hypothetical protein